MKYYHVIIEKKHAFWEGYKIIGVCGYHEKPTETAKEEEQ